jgi:hypothetical protein
MIQVGGNEHQVLTTRDSKKDQTKPLADPVKKHMICSILIVLNIYTNLNKNTPLVVPLLVQFASYPEYPCCQSQLLQL